MKPIKIFMSIGLFLMVISGYAQVAISDNAAADPDPASVLDLQSSSKGFLTPRMTEAQRNAIPAPPKGLMIYQTDETEGFYYNTGTAASPQWSKFTDSNTIAGYWTQVGSNIYYNGGDIGIGNTSPGTLLDVSGPAWFQDSISVDGSPGILNLNAATTYEPSLHLSYEGTTIFKLRYRIGSVPLMDDYFMLNSDVHDDIWGVTSYGRVRQDYKGSYQANLIYSSADRSALFIDNDNALDDAKCINATLSNTLASSESISIAAYNNGDGSALYGANNKHVNFGYIGTELYGVYGENANAYWGAIGAPTAAVYGRMSDGVAAQTLTAGDFAVKGIGVESGTQLGTAYSYNSTLGGVMGNNPVGTAYSFGVAGYTQTANEKQSGAVFGSLADASIWGSLAYRASNGPGTRYAGYFTSTTFGTGTGKAMNGISTDIGIASWGDLIGAEIHGNVYGLYAEGENYSIYAEGDVYRTGADVHVQNNANGENSVMYTMVSTDMVVQTYGIGQLQKGKSNIAFDQAFADVVSADEPVIVTITPIGKSNGVYLDEVDASGFTVGENNHGKSNVQFSWIAIGKRKGYENNQLSPDVIAPDYAEKMQRGLANDNNPETSGEGLYYQNGKLHNGHPQQPKSNGSNTMIEPAQKMQMHEPELAEEIEDDIGNM
ncbi:MAG: hypothetical protein ABFS05_09205 [Bacteroidota bacterium]